MLFSRTNIVMLAPGAEDFIVVGTEAAIDTLKKLLPGLRKKHGQYLAAANYDTSQALHKAKFTFTKQALIHSVKQKQREKRLVEMSGALDAELDLPGFGKTPFPFQRAGIIYAVERERVIIGDDMGLGKTIQGLGTLHLTNAYPALVVVPASLKGNWAESEIPACLSGKVAVIASKKTSYTDLLAADVIVTNYDQLVGVESRTYQHMGQTKRTRTSWQDAGKKHVILSDLAKHIQKIGPKTIICDEAHYLKEASTARTCALMELRHSAKYRLLLSGTPVVNYPSELYALLKFLDRIHEFGGYQGFMQTYCGLRMTDYGVQAKEAHHSLELNKRLRGSCYVRRRKMDVLKDLPDKTRTTYAVDLDNRAEYDKAEQELVNWVRDRVERDEKFLASIAHLPATEQKEAIAIRKDDKAEAAAKAEQIVKINALKTVAAEGKLHAAKEWIDSFLESGEKLVIFATHKKILNWLMKHYPGCARIIAEDSPEERQANVRRFQTNEKIKILVGAQGTSAGNSPAGVGHTLTAASNVLTLEYGWNPALHDQCEDRCHRIGQKDNVTCHYLMAKNTIESEVIAPLIESKRAVAAQVVDGIEGDIEGGILDAVVEYLARKGK